MENTSYIALSRQTALWRQMEVTANNLANMNTPGYKAEHSMFSQYLMPTRSSDRVFAGKVAFTQDVGIKRDYAEGPMTPTSNPLDMAVRDDGFFVVDTPDGPRYTRSGHFRLDENGMVVTSNGHPVLMNGDQPIIVAPNETQITVAGDGTVSTENGVLGRLKVVRFENEQALKKAGDNLYDSPAQPTEVERAQVVQGMLEQSNVQPILEMTSMINLSRAYEASQKMIEGEHERQMKMMSTFVSRA